MGYNVDVQKDKNMDFLKSIETYVNRGERTPYVHCYFYHIGSLMVTACAKLLVSAL